MRQQDPGREHSWVRQCAPRLDRRGRSLSTTETGHFFYEHALHVLDPVEMMMVMTKTANSVEKGRFRTGFVGSTLYGPLPDPVRRFRSSYPESRYHHVGAHHPPAG
jgi:DNA-binding transcriptional LysR family regulator